MSIILMDLFVCDFETEYEKWSANTKAEALYRIKISSDTLKLSHQKFEKKNLLLYSAWQDKMSSPSILILCTQIKRWIAYIFGIVPH